MNGYDYAFGYRFSTRRVRRTEASHGYYDCDGPRVWCGFSYGTPVVFEAEGWGRVTRENTWGTTTGRHITELGGERNRRHRLPALEFEAAMLAAVNGVGPEDARNFGALLQDMSPARAAEVVLELLPA